MKWNTNDGTNNWVNSSIVQVLNNSYYNGLSDLTKVAIGDHVWKLGGYGLTFDVTLKDIYFWERGTRVFEGNPTVYLKESVKITGGTVPSGDPYILSIE